MSYLDVLETAYLSDRRQEQPVEQALMPYLARASAFVDVGACVGQYLRLALEVMPPGATIIALEPEPERCQFLRQRYGDAVDIRPVAAGDHDGETDLFVSGGPLSASLVRHTLALHIAARVPCQRLDTITTALVGPLVVKVDTEGGEAAILDGAPSLLARADVTWLIEVHAWPDAQGREARWVLDVMAREGYRGRRIMPNRWLYSRGDA